MDSGVAGKCVLENGCAAAKRRVKKQLFDGLYNEYRDTTPRFEDADSRLASIWGISMRTPSAFPVLVFVVILAIGAGLAYAVLGVSNYVGSVWIGVCTLVIAVVVSSAIRVASQWEKAVVLRLGHFRSLQGPGLFFIIPIVDTIPYWIDTRVITASFKAEKTLTKDTVPVDVDAVLFWKVLDPKKAALDVADYQSAISWASQTALARCHWQDHAFGHAGGPRKD